MLDRKQQTARQTLDRRLDPLRAALNNFAARQGWIRTIRAAIGMSGSDLARRMGTTRQWLSQLEQGERSGTVTLASMKKAAEALDCQFVYAFIPHTSLEEMVEARAREIAIRELRRIDQTMALENQQVSRSDFDRRVSEYIQDHIRESDLWRDA